MLLSVIILIIYFGIAFRGSEINTNEESDRLFLSKDCSVVLKGLCCLIVVFCHIPYEVQIPLNSVVLTYGTICVSMFYLLSAYGLRYSFEHKKNYSRTFFKNSLLLLIIPYIISCALKMAFGFTPFSGGASFVHGLVLLYILTWAAYNIPLIKSDRARVCVVCVGVFFYSLFIYFTGAGSELGFGWNTSAPGFAWGFLLAGDKVLKRTKSALAKHYKAILIPSIVVMLVSALGYLKVEDVVFWGDYVLRVFVGLALLLAVLFVTWKVRIGNVLSRFLGTISYEIFLLHGFVINALSAANEHIFTDITPTTVPFLLATLVITIVFAYLFHLFNTFLAKKIKALKPLRLKPETK
ncbi:MAG: acyltransferase family protein [Clostridiales bacterium]|nr:acyltransferase family protein [Clostridiales bacterium]